MPEYTYLDTEGHEAQVYHRMLYTTGITCQMCGSAMWRKPTVPRINWGGLRPSKANHLPEVERLFNPNVYAEERAAFERKHYEHEQSTAVDGS